MFRPSLWRWILFGAILLASWNLTAQAPRGKSKFDPERWPKQELDRYLALDGQRAQSHPAVVSSKAMIAGTNDPLAIHAGLDVLAHGGNAVDAALTTSLAQIALEAGANVSYAGIIEATYYDAASGKVYTLNARYNTVQNEKDPLTIPGVGEHSGRTALVPGFMAGVQALHDRFGKLPFATLFDPAIWVAEHGVVVSPRLSRDIKRSERFITRLPEGKRIFAKADGSLYQTGELFRQPELAATLKRVASQGSAYMYKGEWAHHFVDAVQREGGKITLEDLAAYRPMWTEPLQVFYHGYQVVTLGPPNRGGLIALGSLKLAEAADLKKFGHYASSAEALYYLIQILRIETSLANMSPEARKRRYPEINPSPESQLTKETAERLWARIQHNSANPQPAKPGPNHSDGVLAVDERGNVVSILHSFSGIYWGSTGIFVDGVSIPDTASLQQGLIASVGPGARLPSASNPLIVLKGGKPVLASVAIGSGGVDEVTVQNLINILDFGMNPKASVERPNTRGPFYGITGTAPPKPELEKETVGEGDFPEAVLDGVRARGQAIKVVTKGAQLSSWIGIQIDPVAHKISAGLTPFMNAWAEGY
ncbi:MAG TPA: gamma-glutamyltransferase [Bryobacteraceae bacterium]|nr:gamma-glutamyltransferase [Bryobacteraceae bacterium]